MKRIICVISVLLLSISFYACRARQDKIHAPVAFYYRNVATAYNSEDAVIVAETREGIHYEDDLEGLIDLYLAGPFTKEYLSPFPANVQVVSIQVSDEHLVIVLSAPFAQLSGHELTLACACLTRTLTDITQCHSIEISAEDALLDGNQSVIMGAQSFLFLDDSYRG